MTFKVLICLSPYFFSGNQKGKRRSNQQVGGPGAKKGHDPKEKKPEKSSDKLTSSRTTGLVASQAQPFDTRAGAPSVISERSDSSDVTDDKKRLSLARVQKHRQSSAILHPPLIAQSDEAKPPSEEEEREKELAKK